MFLNRRSHTEKKIVCIWTETPNLEYLQHVEELAMNVPDNRHRRRDVYHIALFH